MNLEGVLNTVKSHSIGIALSSEIDGRVLFPRWWLRNEWGIEHCAERIRWCSQTALNHLESLQDRIWGGGL